MNEWVTVAEAAETCGVSRHVVYNWLKRKRIRGKRIRRPGGKNAAWVVKSVDVKNAAENVKNGLPIFSR